MLDSINHEQKLYILKCGDGFSCLGFENAEKKRATVQAWLGSPPIEAPALGTPEHFAAYEQAMKDGANFAAKTGQRCLLELSPLLVGLEGKRVEVTTPSGEKSRFYVGRSTGWMPCHLEIKTRRATGGGAVYVPEGSSVRVLSAR
jgi:hypothetical protein